MTSRTRQQDIAPSVSEALRLMKQAVQSSLDLGDINPQSVCKAVGMTKPQLSSWLTTTSPSPHWDAKVAEWLKQAQARALSANGAQHRGASSSVSSKGSGKAAKASQPAKASPSGGASAKAATSRESTPGGKGVQAGGKASTEQSVRRLKQDLLELETYIPWTAVSSAWQSKRAAWERKTCAAGDAGCVVQQLLALERFLLPCAFEARWSAGNEWRARLLRQNSAADVKQSLRELEDAMHWARFGAHSTLVERYEQLLTSRAGEQLERLGARRLAQVRSTIDSFGYAGLADMAQDCIAIAGGAEGAGAELRELRESICAALGVPLTDALLRLPAKCARSTLLGTFYEPSTSLLRAF
mmetsp:Transcript_7326/g.24251  ORF Transcript_7326/g.24251 Transcript_7326/m.24251 type:complete len:356 (-) Transcript_7326:23-1090(-)